MTRTRVSAKTAGTRFESSIAAHLAAHVDDRIERRRTSGAADRGDFTALRTAHGQRFVLEAKDYGGRFNVAAWLAEADLERGNDAAAAAAVVAKRRGVTYPGRQVVFLTLDDLIVLLAGERPGAA